MQNLLYSDSCLVISKFYNLDELAITNRTSYKYLFRKFGKIRLNYDDSLKYYNNNLIIDKNIIDDVKTQVCLSFYDLVFNTYDMTKLVPNIIFIECEINIDKFSNTQSLQFNNCNIVRSIKFENIEYLYFDKCDFTSKVECLDIKLISFWGCINIDRFKFLGCTGTIFASPDFDSVRLFKFDNFNYYMYM
jgi:hypothetical protein